MQPVRVHTFRIESPHVFALLCDISICSHCVCVNCVFVRECVRTSMCDCDHGWIVISDSAGVRVYVCVSAGVCV